MKHALLVALIPLTLGASALAQPPMQQPNIPDDGVGVDFTQPWMNDLLLRTVPWVNGDNVFDGRRPTSCDKERNALAEDPLDPSLNLAYDQCMAKREDELSKAPPTFQLMPAPPQRKPWPLEPMDKNFKFERLPTIPAHPNAQP